MTIWFVLWICLLFALIYFLGWTLLILMQQKAAWQQYAKARKLRYKHGSLMSSPEMAGEIDGHKISFFTSEHLAEGARGTRKLTAIEVSLNSIMPITGGVASGSMVPILGQLSLKQEYRPTHKSWNDSYMASCSNRYAMEAYLTDERVEALCGIMTLRNVWGILVFRDEAMLLRVDIASPLTKASEIDKLAKQMLSTAGVLELKKGEAVRLKEIADTPAYEAQDEELSEADQESEEKSTSPEVDDSEKP